MLSLEFSDFVELVIAYSLSYMVVSLPFVSTVCTCSYFFLANTKLTLVICAKTQCPYLKKKNNTVIPQGKKRLNTVSECRQRT